MNAKRFLITAAAALVLLAVVLVGFTPMAAQAAQGTDPCSTQAAAIVSQLTISGASVRVTLDPNDSCAFAISPLSTPAALTRTVTSTPIAASVSVTGTGTITGTATPPSVPVRMKALDYIQDASEDRPFLAGQQEWVAPRIQLAIDASDFGLDTAALLYESVANAQQMAAELGTTTLGGNGTLPTVRDFRWLIWDASFNGDTKLPEYYETVFCLTFEGTTDQACLFLGSAAFGDRTYENVDQVFAVR